MKKIIIFLALILFFCIELPLFAKSQVTQPKGCDYNYNYNYNKNYLFSYLENDILESAEFQKACLKLSRDVLTLFTSSQNIEKDELYFPERFLTANYGLFITLEEGYKVRGCRGTLNPVYSNLKEEIINNTIGACIRDNRFKPLTKNELKLVLISITIIESIEPMENIYSVEKKDGIIAEKDGKTGVVLPYEGSDPQIRAQWAQKKAQISDPMGIIWKKIKAVRFKEAKII